MLNVDTPNPAHATIKKLLSDPVDVLLRPKGGWKRPDNLLGALAKEIATNRGWRGAWEEPRIADPEKTEVVGTLNAALKRAANAWLQTKPSPDDEDGARQFFSQWLRSAGTEAVLEAADLTEPLVAAHFHGQGRLAALVLGPAGDVSTAGADIRLLSARKLVAYIDGGGRMQIRQTLEAAGKDIFLDAATARRVLPELETKDEDRCTFSGVVALSYAWVRADDPDPEGAQLAQLRPVLVWWMCERPRRKVWGSRPDTTIQTADFGVFIDFMSMHQPDSGWREEWKCNTTYSKPEQKASFDRALGNIGLALANGAAPALEKLDLSGNKQIGDEGMLHLGDALTRGAAPALEKLNLYLNKIGDEGLRHLADALARGAAPALEELYLHNNPASDDAQQAVEDALKNRK